MNTGILKVNYYTVFLFCGLDSHATCILFKPNNFQVYRIHLCILNLGDNIV